MSIFRLKPLDLGHQSWEASTHKANVWFAHRRNRTPGDWPTINSAGPLGRRWVSRYQLHRGKNAALVEAEAMEDSGHQAEGPPQILVPTGYS